MPHKKFTVAEEGPRIEKFLKHVFELAGFNTLKRENIQIAMGFTATVNVQLGVAALQETVTVEHTQGGVIPGAA